MNTKLLMSSSALFQGLAGVSFLFLPQEIASYFGINPNTITILLLTILGALYLGFAMLNWMAKGNLIGGIYSRPVAIGNFTHFMVVAVSLLKLVFKPQEHLEVVISLTIVYSIFAIAFAYVFLANPAKSKND